MRFNSGQEMLDMIHRDVDLYNADKELYVFNYNMDGSICYYTISNEEAEELRKKEEYWGAYLGLGGLIYEDPSNECYEQGDLTNLDWCNDNYEGEWEDVTK